jgi:predicted thioesterase
MPNIPLGATGTSRIDVTDANAISFLGNTAGRVLSTPALIGYLEMTARDLIKSYLLDGEDSVGTQVNVCHLAATPIGMTVRFEAEVQRVNGRRVEFRVSAFDAVEQIAEGTHERAVISIERFAGRVQQKRNH